MPEVRAIAATLRQTLSAPTQPTTCHVSLASVGLALTVSRLESRVEMIWLPTAPPKSVSVLVLPLTTWRPLQELQIRHQLSKLSTREGFLTASKFAATRARPSASNPCCACRTTRAARRSSMESPLCEHWHPLPMKIRVSSTTCRSFQL